MARTPTAALSVPLLLLSLAQPALAQGSSPAPGFRLFGPFGGTDTLLVDRSGTVVHTWPSAHKPGAGVYLLEDGTLLRAINLGVGGGGGAGGGVQRVALDGTVLWDYRFQAPASLSHHDIEPMPNGNVLLIVWHDKTAAEAIAAGRDPATIPGVLFRPDYVVEVEPTGPTTGRVVWEWHVWDHLIQDFDPRQANYGAVAKHPERIDINFGSAGGDWTHMNGIDYDPVHDWIVLSPATFGEVWIIDHGTTTAEARGSTGGRWGKGGDLLYRWGNPAAYRAGTAADQQLFFQHDPNFVPDGYPGAGNLLVFNNRRPGGSAVYELVLPLDPAGNFVLGGDGRYGPAGPVWSYSASDFGSVLMSSAQRLPNGNTLICPAGQSRVFEVTPAGRTVWEYAVGGEFVFHAHYYEHFLWADARSVSRTGGGQVTFDLIAGSEHAGSVYALLGSASGTAPGTAVGALHLPLNLDAWTDHTWAIDPFPYSGNIGVLDAFGRARATFALPAGVLPAAAIGLELHHAFLVADPVRAAITHASNAVPLRFVR